MNRSRLISVIRSSLRAAGSPSAGQTVVVGLSGGPDSVALLDVLVTLAPKAGFRVVAAHLDHGLRSGSAEDAQFCRELCQRLGVPLRVGSADVRGRAGRDKAGLEDAGRRERYAFLQAVREREGAAALVLAHTRDDQAETLLLRLLRGAGTDGLASMRARGGALLRPMLDASRRDVLEHLQRRGLAFREDESNADLAFARNRVRHELIPYLESRFNPRVRDTLARQAALLADESDWLAARAGALLAEVERAATDGIALSLAGLRSAPPALARRALRLAIERTGGLRGVDRTHVERLLALSRSEGPSGRRLALPNRREARFCFDELRIGPARPQASAFAYPLRIPGRVSLPGGSCILADTARGPAVSKPTSAVVEVPEGPLTVRTRRAGDHILSKGRRISLGRILMERRVPADERGGLPLVAAGGDVVWIPGLGLAAAAGFGGRYVRLSLEHPGAAAGAASRA